MCAGSLKICFVSTQYPPLTLGGAGVYAHCLCTELTKLGHEVHVVSPTLHETNEVATNSPVVHRIKVINKPMLKTPSYWLKLRKNYSRLQKEINFDILHANVTSDLSLTKNLVKTPRAVTIHHLSKTTFATVDASPPRSFENLREETSMIFWFEKKLVDLDKIVTQRADKVIAVSQFTKNTLTSAYHVPLQKIHVIHNGIYPEQYTCTKTEIEETKHNLNIENALAILYVGRLEQRKGIIYLLEAFAHLAKDYTCKLVIAGDGNQTQLKQHAQTLGIKEKIIFTGKVDNNTLKRLYNICDVFVLPSLLEGFGLTILEAMAAGKPVVATNVGGIPEIMKNNVHGKLVEPKNPRQLSTAIRFFLENPKTSRKIGEHNRKYVKERFSWAKTAKETTLLYETLINSRQGALHENK
ncbi:MAG: glycosyltransferase family 4 protein [Candidatus Bathyarchaeia archaeon]|jgi:glycosyltransferase involved in cell wall biosynthesis|nr:glycosyltransferase family 4 protein [Candidatus Bathyarchaeota archaeon A05DMB-4]MDH7594832.1 glycosyltransferase family 4 protein [Candidatus Bathyarchaeota archaeon]